MLPSSATTVFKSVGVAVEDISTVPELTQIVVVAKLTVAPCALRAIGAPRVDVRFAPNSGYRSAPKRCPLWVISGRCRHASAMSALPPKVDIPPHPSDVRFVPIADIGQ
jgi:hypothetical protein